MEPHVPTSTPNPGFPPDVLAYYDACYALAMAHYRGEVERVRALRFQELTPDAFWAEYIWCVYASGFNAKVLTSKYEALRQAWNDFRNIASFPTVWARVSPLLNNKRKAEAIHGVGIRLHEAWYNDAGTPWWERWREANLATVERIQESLPFMGPITCHHLARNIGLDTVKPDLHLTRLANYYQISSPLRMCEYIAVNRWQGYYSNSKTPRPAVASAFVWTPNKVPERIGVVDLVLWYGASTWGTLDIKDVKLGG